MNQEAEIRELAEKILDLCNPCNINVAATACVSVAARVLGILRADYPEVATDEWLENRLAEFARTIERNRTMFRGKMQ